MSLRYHPITMVEKQSKNGRLHDMPTLNIKDPEVHRMATLLAIRWQTTRTGAVRKALSDAVAEVPKPIDIEKIKALLDEIQPFFLPGTTMESIDNELYDEDGLPK